MFNVAQQCLRVPLVNCDSNLLICALTLTFDPLVQRWGGRSGGISCRKPPLLMRFQGSLFAVVCDHDGAGPTAGSSSQPQTREAAAS